MNNESVSFCAYSQSYVQVNKEQQMKAPYLHKGIGEFESPYPLQSQELYIHHRQNLAYATVCLCNHGHPRQATYT